MLEKKFWIWSYICILIQEHQAIAKLIHQRNVLLSNELTWNIGGLRGSLHSPQQNAASSMLHLILLALLSPCSWTSPIYPCCCCCCRRSSPSRRPKKGEREKKTIHPTTTSNNNRLLCRHWFQSSRYTFISNWDVHARGRWKGYIKLSACMHDYWANYCSSNWKNMRRCSSINQFIGSRSRVRQCTRRARHDMIQQIHLNLD